jgi:hypothetical protein
MEAPKPKERKNQTAPSGRASGIKVKNRSTRQDIAKSEAQVLKSFRKSKLNF